MKSHSALTTGGHTEPSSLEAQAAKSRFIGVRPVTAYTLLLGSPITVLVGHVPDRPDVQSVAILGYN
ncbi:hypothetical protein PQR53_28040 [Paraburkholderia fungorum]|jgi:hypothetical protein|uniref:hypothetical protein n=1 Tax=Paraburkholderia fungorum TaxID=134537 RepID=UPI0038B6CBD1